MGVVHYSASDLAKLLRRAAVAYQLREHLERCEQCHMLLELVRRVEGEPTDEQTEVLLDLLVSHETQEGTASPMTAESQVSSV